MRVEPQRTALLFRSGGEANQARRDGLAMSRPNVSDAPLVMIVDDDATPRDRLARALRERGYEVHTAGHHTEALAIAQQEEVEYVVLDLRMAGPSGLELIRHLKALDAGIRIVVLTSYGSIATALDAMRLGACHYLQEPANPDEIHAAFTRNAAPISEIRPIAFEAPSLERVKWEYISRVLSDCSGNVSETARRLGLHRRTLQRILLKFPPIR
jgi:two-component system response regulator RegA